MEPESTQFAVLITLLIILLVFIIACIIRLPNIDDHKSTLWPLHVYNESEALYI